MDKKILIIGNDKNTRAWLLGTLSQAGLHASAIANGRNAVLQFFLTQPDLIILDILLHEPDRWEMLHQIRELSTVPVIVLTIADDYRVRVEGLDRGADYVMAKPVDARELRARVTALFRRMQKNVRRPGFAGGSETYTTIEQTWLTGAPGAPYMH